MERLRIIVMGYIVRGPIGGMTWHHLQYVIGLAELGHDVYFLEDSDDYPSCYDPSRHVTGTDPAYGLAYASRVFEKQGFGDRWAFYDAHTGVWHGPCAGRSIELCASADVLVNISGVNPLREYVLSIPIRIFVDTDPVFTQIRHCTDPLKRTVAERHTHFFSFGENIASGTSTVPDDGFAWMPTRQPIVLLAWPVTPGPIDGLFTTVMQWDSYPAHEFNGARYGMKADSFAPFMDLPSRTGRILELALGSPSAPRSVFAEAGWRLRDPLEVTRDPWTYQQYIRQSRAEFSVAKHGYVVSRCGWFSERGAAYLASGRPVLTQETGFSAWLPAGEGVLSFSTPEQAAEGVQRIVRDYGTHCRNARRLAEEYFNANDVLERMLQSVTV